MSRLPPPPVSPFHDFLCREFYRIYVQIIDVQQEKHRSHRGPDLGIYRSFRVGLLPHRKNLVERGSKGLSTRYGRDHLHVFHRGSEYGPQVEECNLCIALTLVWYLQRGATGFDRWVTRMAFFDFHKSIPQYELRGHSHHSIYSCDGT
jgi:hypothetical protein